MEDDEIREDQNTLSWLRGQTVGIERARAALLNRAGEAFARGEDDLARTLRDEAKAMKAMMVTARSASRQYAEDYDLDVCPCDEEDGR